MKKSKAFSAGRAADVTPCLEYPVGLCLGFWVRATSTSHVEGYANIVTVPSYRVVGFRSTGCLLGIERGKGPRRWLRFVRCSEFLSQGRRDLGVLVEKRKDLSREEGIPQN